MITCTPNCDVCGRNLQNEIQYRYTWVEDMGDVIESYYKFLCDTCLPTVEVGLHFAGIEIIRTRVAEIDRFGKFYVMALDYSVNARSHFIRS